MLSWILQKMAFQCVSYLSYLSYLIALHLESWIGPHTSQYCWGYVLHTSWPKRTILLRTRCWQPLEKDRMFLETVSFQLIAVSSRYCTICLTKKTQKMKPHFTNSPKNHQKQHENRFLFVRHLFKRLDFPNPTGVAFVGISDEKMSV